VIYIVLLFWATVIGTVAWRYRKTMFIKAIVQVYQSVWAGEDQTDLPYGDSVASAGVAVAVTSLAIMLILTIASFIWSIIWALN